MDTDGFPLSAISEKSDEINDETPKRRSNKTKRQTTTSTNENGVNLENGDVSSSSSTGQKRNKNRTTIDNSISSEPIETTKKIDDEIELTEIADEDDGEPERERRLADQLRMSDNQTEPMTMISSFTTGGENEVIEIHQFSVADLDVYLDIYFDTLNNRLRNYVGGNDQLNQFRTSMKNRIGRKYFNDNEKTNNETLFFSFL